MKDLPEATFYQIALVFLGDLHKYVCDEKSMNPTIADGEVVLVDKNATDYKVGDIVLAQHPLQLDLQIVKRIQSINDKGHYFLIGDNPEDSEDSRHYGAVTLEYIKGKVIARTF